MHISKEEVAMTVKQKNAIGRKWSSAIVSFAGAHLWSNTTSSPTPS
ncbi:MAG: hypothetical protein WBQ34_07000 [Candidatus Acidiferrales bacterium]